MTQPTRTAEQIKARISQIKAEDDRNGYEDRDNWLELCTLEWVLDPTDPNDSPWTETVNAK